MAKTLPSEKLVEAMRAVAKGGVFFSPAFHKVKHEWLLQPKAFQKVLSDREQEVLQKVVGGFNDDRIASQLAVASRCRINQVNQSKN